MEVFGVAVSVRDVFFGGVADRDPVLRRASRASADAYEPVDVAIGSVTSVDSKIGNRVRRVNLCCTIWVFIFSNQNQNYKHTWRKRPFWAHTGSNGN